MEATGDTHTGKARRYNDDAFGVLWDPRVLMVADGLGSRPAGDVAAKMAVNTVLEFFRSDDITWPDDVPGSPAEPRAQLVAGITRANARIWKAASRSATLDGMATTFAGLVAAEDRLWIAHVGDSRCYRFRERRLELLTTDHHLDSDPEGRSHFSAELIAKSRPTALTRALGQFDKVAVEVREEELHAGDAILLVTDGVTAVLDDAAIAGVLGEYHEVGAAVAALIQRANDRGGPDNITAVLARWEPM
jgi:serine/threonine protein phosphatase PrpC